MQQFPQCQIVTFQIVNQTDRPYEKGGHRKAEIRFGFPEWPTAEITGTHIRELTWFQREISAGLRRSSQTSRVNPRSSAPRKCMKSSRSSCISRFIIRTAILPEPFSQRASSRRLLVRSTDSHRNFKSSRSLAWYDEATFTKSLLISKLQVCSDYRSFPSVRLARMPMLMRNEKSVERLNDLHLIILQQIN